MPGLKPSRESRPEEFSPRAYSPGFQPVGGRNECKGRAMSYFRGQMHRKSLSVPEFPRKSRGALTGNDEIQFTVSVSVVE